MNERFQSERLLYRLTALWGFSEAVLGGLLHAAKIPVTGLVVGGFAVCVLMLISQWTERRVFILTATFHVLVIKFIISPYTPPAAYSAVLLQGVLAWLLFPLRKTPLLFGITLGVVSMFYSALLKVITLTVVFGNSLWQALDSYAVFIAKQFNIAAPLNFSFSFWLIAGYLSIHLAAGISVGALSAKLLNWLQFSWSEYQHSFDEPLPEVEQTRATQKKTILIRKIFTYTAVLLIVVLLLALSPQMTDSPIFVFLRAGIVLLVWFGIISPLLRYLISTILRKKAFSQRAFYESVFSLFPVFRRVVQQSLRKASEARTYRKVKVFLISLFIGALLYEPE